MSTGKFIGIDFGTTNTAVCLINKDEFGTKITSFGEDGNFPFSSIVAIPKTDDKLLFGRDVRANRQQYSENYTIITSMKSYLGTDKEFPVGNNRYTAEDISAAFLQYIKQSIQNRYKTDITEAVFAFPVDFSPTARRSLNNAAQRAGIKVKGFVSESTAAYIANTKETKAFSKVMVVDWGGGTLDISILNLKSNRVYESAVYGEKIGGDDIDKELAYRLHARLAKQQGINVSFDDMSAENKDQIIAACENAKIEFSDFEEDYIITLRNYGEFGTKSINLDYETFEDIIKPLITKNVLSTIDKAMKIANVTSSGIDAVILVGGSSNLKPFANAMVNVFGADKIIIPSSVQWSVAQGAAHICSMNNEYKLSDDICVLLSDDTLYPILKKEKDGVNKKIESVTFSLTEDANDAHFIFTNSSKSNIYGKLNIPTKGFLKEKLVLSAEIGEDQIATVTINNNTMGTDCIEKLEINKLSFYYDLNEVI